MAVLTKVQLETLRTVASEAAARRDAAILIVAALRQSCLMGNIAAGDAELFVIAEAAITAQHDLPSALTPRARTDRRIRERRRRIRRKRIARMEGLGALLEKFNRLGQPSRRKAERRRSADRRALLRRMHVRRTENR